MLEIQNSRKVDIVLANPPFGGNEKEIVKENFPIQTSETAFLFLQHFMKMLKVGGRAGIVIKNTFLSIDDNSLISLRKEILNEYNLHTILDLPQGTFQGAGVKTVVLFFEKGTSTKRIWYYQLNLDRKLGKKKPLTVEDLSEFTNLYKNKKETYNSWFVDVKDVDKKSFDLSVNNPNVVEHVDERKPDEILSEIESLEVNTNKILKQIRKIL